MTGNINTCYIWKIMRTYNTIVSISASSFCFFFLHPCSNLALQCVWHIWHQFVDTQTESRCCNNQGDFLCRLVDQNKVFVSLTCVFSSECSSLDIGVLVEGCSEVNSWLAGGWQHQPTQAGRSVTRRSEVVHLTAEYIYCPSRECCARAQLLHQLVEEGRFSLH